VLEEMIAMSALCTWKHLGLLVCGFVKHHQSLWKLKAGVAVLGYVNITAGSLFSFLFPFFPPD